MKASRSVARLSAPLSVWAVSDGRTGIENQALGLAEAVRRRLGGAAGITVKRIGWRAPFDRLPGVLNPALPALLKPGSSPIAPPWPDLWIAAGRASIPLSVRMRRRSRNHSFVVQIQDPRWPARLFDLVVPPRHDRLTGPNVLPILGAPNRITAEGLAEAHAGFRDRLEALPPGRRIAVLVGGRSRAFDLPAAGAAALADRIADALDRDGGVLMLSFSRRTPPEAREAMTRRLQGRGWIWDGEGANPYFAFLAAADLVLVTEDSVNMAAEAASAGKPVMVLPLEGGGGERIGRFHEALREGGWSRPFAGALAPWPVEPLAETDRAAAEVLRRMGIET